MATLLEPSFIERDPEKTTQELIDLYETMTGKTLYPAQPERLFIDVIAYRESLVRIQIQAAAVKNLVLHSSGVMMDELGVLVGCDRLAEQPARTTLRFTLTGVRDYDVIIPAGTRRGSKDGRFAFATDVALTIPAGQTLGDVYATSETAGVTGNGYLAGEIREEVDLIPYLLSAVNVSTTVGGSDVEDDDHYRERIILKPSSYSTAGPEDAYIYWAKTAHQDIVDVKVLSPTPVHVDVYPLMKNGLPSEEILNLVNTTLSARNRRPLTDEVAVLAPTRVPFAIVASVTLLSNVNDSDKVLADLVATLEGYAAELRAGLGIDLVRGKIEQLINAYKSVYDSVLTTPPANQVLADNEWLDCTDITVTLTGYAHG